MNNPYYNYYHDYYNYYNYYNNYISFMNGYDLGIKNYFNNINKNNSKRRRRNNNKNKCNQNTQTDDSNNNNTSNNNNNSLFSNLFKETDSKNSNDTHYLEDSDDEIDVVITLDDLRINDTQTSYNNIEIITLDKIINKNEISSIDELIEIGNYYEKNVKNIIYEKDYNPFTHDTFDENLILTSILNNLGIPIDKNKIIDNLYFTKGKYYTINLEKVYNIRGPLIKLKKMIGLDNIKNDIIDMILYYLMDFERENNNMLHMTLEGSPGCGKTKLAKIISKILTGLGILSSNKIVYARRTDMIAQYLGQTGHKTQNVIDSASGGVLFIDEAYSLGNAERDIYAKECMDVLNQNLSDNKKKFICIIAGYSDDLEKYFFSSNQGLVRRFPFRYKIKEYTYKELMDIFIKKIYKLNWKISNDILNLEEFFKNNTKHFVYYGGDIDILIQDIKYTHSRRIVCSHPKEFKIINKNDLDSAMKKFIDRRKNNNDCNDTGWNNMYL